MPLFALGVTDCSVVVCDRAHLAHGLPFGRQNGHDRTMQSIAPMLAKAVAEVPAGPDFSYEPKWDGFRAIVHCDGADIEIGSRGSKSLTRYFPELVEAFASQLDRPCILDGEIVVRSGPVGDESLDWELLSERIHPAASRVSALAAKSPALFVAFDLLGFGDEVLLDIPFRERRSRLVEVVGRLVDPIHLSQATTDIAVAREWLVAFEGAGLDGIVAKPLGASYAPDKRVMFKVKHHRTADVVVLGYRVHTSGAGVGSLLLGLYDGDTLRQVGGASAFTDRRRRELIDELAPYVLRDNDGDVVAGRSERSRFSGAKDRSFVRVRPEVVVEVRYDQMEGPRFRHTVQFTRWRPDREPRSCTFAQLEVPVAYDLSRVLL